MACLELSGGMQTTETQGQVQKIPHSVLYTFIAHSSSLYVYQSQYSKWDSVNGARHKVS